MDFDLKLAQECTRSFSLAAGLGCLLAAADGKELYASGPHCGACRICRLAGKPEGSCRSSRQYGMNAAERFGGKYIYFCSMGLTCFTAPLLDGHHGVAQLTAGPFLMVDPDDYAAYDLKQIPGLSPSQEEELLSELRNLPFLETERVSALADMLFMTVAFINNVSEINRMLESRQSNQIQSQISDYIQDLKKTEAPLPPYPYRTEQSFLQALADGKTAQAQRLLNELLGYIMFSSGSNMDLIRSRTEELLVLISRTAARIGEDPEFIRRKIDTFRAEKQRFTTTEELCLWLSGVVRELMTALMLDRSARHSDIVHRTMTYLREHYTEPITLEDMAKNVFMSPSYLSRTFKKETGSSLTDYLNRIRIEKSREMLMQPDCLITDVAVRCGFGSESYFDKVFRQLTGMTPGAFRKQSGQASE